MHEKAINYSTDKAALEALRNRWDNLNPLKAFESNRAEVGAAFDENIVKICNEYLPSEGAILDIGAGTGELRKRMPEKFSQRTTHTDISPVFLNALRATSPEASAVVADATRLPFNDASFDAIISLSTYHTLHDLHSGITEAARVLKPGGRFINILDITPSAIPMVEYLNQRGQYLFPSVDIVENNARQIAYHVPSVQELLAFIEDHVNDIDPLILSRISMTIQNQMVVYAGFEVDQTGQMRNEFALALQRLKFPGRIEPITTLFEERLVDNLQMVGFEDISSEDVQTVKETTRLWTPQADDTNFTQKVNGSVTKFYSPTIPESVRIIAASVQCVSAVKA